MTKHRFPQTFEIVCDAAGVPHSPADWTDGDKASYAAIRSESIGKDPAFDKWEQHYLLASDQYHPNPLHLTDAVVSMPSWNSSYTYQSDFGLDILEAVVAAGGFDPHYEAVEDWLYDFFPCLDMRNSDDLLRIASSPRFAIIAAGFQTIFGFDLRGQVEVGGE